MVQNKGSLHIKILLLCVILPISPVYAQEKAVERGDFWICPGGEIAMFSISNIAYGGSLSLGYGNRFAIGVKAAWLIDGKEEITTLEINFLFRWHILNANSGLYIQLACGPAVFTQYEKMTVPARLGAVSAGIDLGWRFLLGRYWFIDGAFRAGYPYITGAGISAGVRI